MKLSRVHSLFAGLSSILLTSCPQIGFDLNQYMTEGNLPMLFSHILLPLTGNNILYCDKCYNDNQKKRFVHAIF